MYVCMYVCMYVYMYTYLASGRVPEILGNAWELWGLLPSLQQSTTHTHTHTHTHTEEDNMIMLPSAPIVYIKRIKKIKKVK